MGCELICFHFTVYICDCNTWKCYLDYKISHWKSGTNERRPLVYTAAYNYNISKQCRYYNIESDFVDTKPWLYTACVTYPLANILGFDIPSPYILLIMIFNDSFSISFITQTLPEKQVHWHSPKKTVDYRLFVHLFHALERAMKVHYHPLLSYLHLLPLLLSFPLDKEF